MDYIKYLFFGIISPLIIKYSNVEVMLEHGNEEFMWYLFISYGLAIISFSYFMSLLFSKAGVAQSTLFLLSFIGGYVLNLTCFILEQIPATSALGENARWVFRFLPPFCFTNGLMSMNSRKFISAKEGETDLLSPWDLRVGGTEIYVL